MKARRPFTAGRLRLAYRVAIPVSPTVVGLATPFHENVKDAALLPMLVGRNATVMMQLVARAMGTLQVVLWMKNSLAFGPVICGFGPGPIWIAGLMMSGFTPLFLTVRFAVIVVFTVRRLPPTWILAGNAAIVVGGTTPVPESATVWGLPAAFDVSDSDAFLAPPAVGVNRIDTTQLPPAATVVPEHPSAEIEKSPAFAPPIEAPPAGITRFALPLFVTVTD
jgi:hypothetical protein